MGPFGRRLILGSPAGRVDSLTRVANAFSCCEDTALMVQVPGDWRFKPPAHPNLISDHIPPAAFDGFRRLCITAASAAGGATWDSLETFKYYFCQAAGKEHFGSSEESWAHTDLLRDMELASASAVGFIEAVVDGLDAVGGGDAAVPSVAIVNHILEEHGLAYQVVDDELRLRPDVPDQSAFEAATPIPIEKQGWERPINVFVSSPGDLQPERMKVIEVCKRLGGTLRIPIVPILWEGGAPSHKDVPPLPPDVTGTSGQAVINQQIVDDKGGMDVFVGFIWSRMGTPTGKWRSGTEAELQLARELRKRTGRPVQILFYHKIAPLPYDHDPEQVALAKDFAIELGGQGLTAKVTSLEDLEARLVSDIESAISRVMEVALPSPANVCPECGSGRLEYTAETRGEPESDGDGGVTYVGYEVPMIRCEDCNWDQDLS